jgi:hypothetical protein
VSSGARGIERTRNMDFIGIIMLVLAVIPAGVCFIEDMR